MDFSLKHITSGQVMKLGRRHCFLKLFPRNDLSEEGVSVQQHRVIKEDVIDANYFFFAQNNVGSCGIALVHLEPDTEVSVVIEIGAGRNNPVDKAGFDQWNQC